MNPVLASSDHLHYDGLTPHQLVQEILQIIEQFSVEVPGRRRSWPQSVRGRVAALDRLGVLRSKISDLTGLSRATVFFWCRGQVARKPGRPSGIRGHRFIQLPAKTAQALDVDCPVQRPDSKLPDPELPQPPAPDPVLSCGLRLCFSNGSAIEGIASIADAILLYRELAR